MQKYLTSSFFYLAIGFLPLASNFLLTPFFTRYLSPEEYGILALAALFQAYLAIFISVGLDSAFSRQFFLYYQKPKLLNAFFSTIFCCIAAVSVLCSLLLFLTGDQLFDFIFRNDTFTFYTYGHLVLATTITSLLHGVALSYYRNSENIKGFALLAVGFFVLMTLGSVIGVIVLELGAWGSLAGKLAGSAVVVVVFFVCFFSKHPLIFRAKFLTLAIKFGLPLVPYLLLGITLDNLDRFLIERYLSLADLGKYNIAFLIASVMAIILHSLSSAVNPAVFRLLEEKKDGSNQQKHREINHLFRGVHLFIVLVISVVLIVLIPLVQIVIDSEYHGIIAYLPLLFLAFVPRVYFVIYSFLLFFHQKTKLLPVINSVALVLGGFGMYLLLHFFGISGLCIGVVLIKALQSALAFYYVKSNGYYTSVLFSMPGNHLLSVFFTLAIVAAVVAGSYFSDFRIYFYPAAGFANLVLIYLLFRKELIQLVNMVRSAG